MSEMQWMDGRLEHLVWTEEINIKYRVGLGTGGHSFIYIDPLPPVDTGTSRKNHENILIDQLIQSSSSF